MDGASWVPVDTQSVCKFCGELFHEMDGASWAPADTAGAWRRRQIAPMPDCRNELLILLIKIMGPAELQKLEIAYIVFIHDDSLE